MDRDQLVRLWRAANVHASCMVGEYLAEEYDEDDETDAPDDEEIVEAVISYLKGSV